MQACLICDNPTTEVCDRCQRPMHARCAHLNTLWCPDCSCTPEELAFARAAWGERWWIIKDNE